MKIAEEKRYFSYKKFLIEFFRPTKWKIILTAFFSLLVLLISIGIPLPILSNRVYFTDSSKIDLNPILYMPISAILETFSININFGSLGFYIYILLLLLYYYIIASLSIFICRIVVNYLKNASK